MPKVVDHVAYRKALVDQSTQLFAQHGYQIGMRDIAAALSVSKGTLYHYFPTKEDLFRAVCEAVVQSDIAALYASTPPDTSLAARLENLLHYCQTQEAWFVQQYLILTDYIRAAGAESARQNPVLVQATQTYLLAVAEYLKISDPTTIGGILIFVNGLIMQRYLDGQQTDFRQMAQWLIQLLT